MDTPLGLLWEDEPTVDPDIVMEERRPGYRRFRCLSTGFRWEVRGVCDDRGNCLVGAWIDGEYIETLERAHELALAYRGPISPVGPGFKGCCPLVVTILD